MCSRSLTVEMNMDAELEKTVLVPLQTEFGNRNRAAKFCGGKKELLCATKAKFSDVLSQDSDFLLQISDDQLG